MLMRMLFRTHIMIFEMTITERVDYIFYYALDMI